MIKASAGGGGRGLRVVRSDEELRENMEVAAREAQASFGDSRRPDNISRRFTPVTSSITKKWIENRPVIVTITSELLKRPAAGELPEVQL